MASYVVTGLSRGIGWEFLSQLSANPKNTVVGIVRSRAATDKRITEELSDRSNISIRVAAAVTTVTGGKLDYLIANAAYLPLYDQFESIGALGKDPKELTAQFHKIIDTNVLATIHLFNLFTPLILRGSRSSPSPAAWATSKWSTGSSCTTLHCYSISKAAVNMATAKFSAQYKKDGAVPQYMSWDGGHRHAGTVNSGVDGSCGALMGKFQSYAPHFKRPVTPTDAVKAVLSVIENSSIENGSAGDFVSHFGNKQWL